MKNELKELFLIGVGAASLTRKKAEKTIKKFVSKKTINRQQAEELLKKVMAEAKKARKVLAKEGKREVIRLRKGAVIKTKAAAKNISKKIDSLSKRALRQVMKL